MPETRQQDSDKRTNECRTSQPPIAQTAVKPNFRCLFPGGVLGPVSFGLLFVSACSVCRVLFSLCVPLLLCAFFCFCCLGLLRIRPFSPRCVSPLSCSPPCPSAPSGPVSVLLVPPSRYLVVFATARLSCLWYGVLSSLLLMATKASALCGALPSTPCCGCCSGALLSCTEGFALDPEPLSGHRQSCMRPSPWPVLLSPSCPCCLPGRSLPSTAAGLLLLPPRPCSHLGFYCPLLSLCVVLFFLSGLLFSLDETQIWLGICGSSWLLVLCFFGLF